jgi:hypothetical protein
MNNPNQKQINEPLKWAKDPLYQDIQNINPATSRIKYNEVCTTLGNRNSNDPLVLFAKEKGII